MSGQRPVVGILGAGKLGTVLGQLTRRAGLDVLIASSRPPEAIALTVEVLVPGAQAVDAATAVRESDVVVLAMPLSRARETDPSLLDGRLVIDAMNYWWEVDGEDPELAHPEPSSSEQVARWFPGARVVKAFNHTGYHDLYDTAAPAGAPGRRAIALAGDVAADVEPVAALVGALGFDPLPLGSLHAGRALEPGHPAFGANLARAELASLLDA